MSMPKQAQTVSNVETKESDCWPALLEYLRSLDGFGESDHATLDGLLSDEVWCGCVICACAVARGVWVV